MSKASPRTPANFWSNYKNPTLNTSKVSPRQFQSNKKQPAAIPVQRLPRKPKSMITFGFYTRAPGHRIATVAENSSNDKQQRKSPGKF